MIWKCPAVLAAPVLVLVVLLSGCGGSSGAATTANPITGTPEVANYNGPPPRTADVQAFKLALWDNLMPNNRCGSCHNPSQTPRFVRTDDINLAYDAANTVVNLSDPDDSLMVNKIRGGHFCWLTSNAACADILTTYIENWAGNTLGGSGKQIQLVAPPLKTPGASKNYPVSATQFQNTVYPLLITFCAGCHTDSAAIPQSPFFASSEVAAAYEAAKSKMDLDSPSNSRFVLRLGNEFHNCWSSSCQSDADDMLDAITALSDAITPTQIDPDLVTSMALNLTDGIISSDGGRHDTNTIALYEFKTGSGNTAFDTSGVEPALNLTLSGDYRWVGGFGVQLIDGKAQGSTAASAKLRDLITATNEYSIEAWVAPANVTQDGPARIVSYSGGASNRNVMLGQTLYNYDFRNRNDQTDGNGEPRLSTSDDAEVLQATLQHVVATYDPANGRRLYVNGAFTGDLDTVPGGLLSEWDDTFALVVGSEVDNDSRWAGTVRLLALHNRALTDAQILQNYEVGVGEKYFLLFNVSSHVGVADAYIVFEVSQYDSYSYLFDEPFFVILNDQASPGTIDVAGMRIGLNGREVSVGQAYRNLDFTITDAGYTAGEFLYLSELGTVVPLEKGPEDDEFFLSFERLGDATNVVVEPVSVAPPAPPDVPRGDTLGIRDFAEINATMAGVTGITRDDPQVAGVYDAVFQAMPVQTNLQGFISSQQMGITQLAIKYCSVLVDDPVARAGYFPGFDFNAGVATAFTDRSLIIDPLIDNMVGSGVGTQPDPGDLTTELNDLIDRLTACGGACEPDRTERVVKAACAAVLGSAAMLVQ